MTKRILIISANPLKTERIGVDEEYRVIREVWEKSARCDQYEIEHSVATRPDDFQGKLLKFKPHIVHFSGHGTEVSLAFNTDTINPNWIRQDVLRKFFELAASHVECVILNACHSEALADSISKYIEYAIGMEGKIDDVASLKFSQGFYTALFAGENYSSAFQQGCLAIQSDYDIPENLKPEQKPKLKIKAPRQIYVPGCQTDICVSFADAEASWVEALLFQLDNLMALRLGERNLYTVRSVSDSCPEPSELSKQAAVLMTVLSPNYLKMPNCQDSLDAFLKNGNDGKRVFLLEYGAVSRPESLQKAWTYRFYQPDDRPLTMQDMNYHCQLEMLARDLSDKLRQLRQEAEFRQKLAEKRQKMAEPPVSSLTDFPPVLLFVNCAPEDRSLSEQITQFLNHNKIDHALPLDLTHNPSPAEIRQDLDNNLQACDLLIVIYGGTSPVWVREQLLYCRKIQRKRETPLRVMLVHNDVSVGAKPPLNLKFDNLRIYDCPPSDIGQYLFECKDCVLG